jgi:hypothetical protein
MGAALPGLLPWQFTGLARGVRTWVATGQNDGRSIPSLPFSSAMSSVSTQAARGHRQAQMMLEQMGDVSGTLTTLLRDLLSQ